MRDFFKWSIASAFKGITTDAFVWRVWWLLLSFRSVCVRLEVWRRVQSLWSIPNRLCPSHRSSWFPVAATGPQNRAWRRSRTVCCIIGCRCCCGVHNGCTWDRSNHWGRGMLTHVFFFCWHLSLMLFFSVNLWFSEGFFRRIWWWRAGWKGATWQQIWYGGVCQEVLQAGDQREGVRQRQRKKMCKSCENHHKHM